MTLELKNHQSLHEMPDQKRLAQLVGVFKKAEMKKKGSGKDYDLHFKDINPKTLTAEDLTILNKLLTKRLTYNDLTRHKKMTFENQPPSKKRLSSMALNGWISNYLSNPEQLKWFDPNEYETLNLPGVRYDIIEMYDGVKDKNKENRKQEENFFVENVSPEALTIEDMELYQGLLGKKLTPEDKEKHVSYLKEIHDQDKRKNAESFARWIFFNAENSDWWNKKEEKKQEEPES